jgi:hypothetical protein
MNQALVDLAERIRSELKDLRRVVERAEKGWERSNLQADDMYVDGVALNLHGFYSGLERLFELVATVVDASKPQGVEWHKELLEQMAKEIPNIRPAVISGPMREALDEYRRFRHLIRNVYTFKLNPSKVGELLDKTPRVYAQVRREMLAFANFLERQARKSKR